MGRWRILITPHINLQDIGTKVFTMLPCPNRGWLYFPVLSSWELMYSTVPTTQPAPTIFHFTYDLAHVNEHHVHNDLLELDPIPPKGFACHTAISNSTFCDSSHLSTPHTYKTSGHIWEEECPKTEGMMMIVGSSTGASTFRELHERSHKNKLAGKCTPLHDVCTV